jgi:SAM-dependent methyltransferase
MKSSLDSLLNAYWLRPETALWRELDIRAMNSFEFSAPSLDLGCGDGLFSYIRAGGCLEEKFDVFRYLANVDDYFKNVDVYDSASRDFDFNQTHAPRYKFDVGFDHKNNLLAKARFLDLYKKIRCGDANGTLPFEDSSFRSVFSNILYWLNDPAFVLSEINRILVVGGRVCLMLPNERFKEYSFYYQMYIKTMNPKWKFLEKIDRGRFSENIRHAYSVEKWEMMFNEAGFKVLNHNSHLSKTTIQIWDIGFRPIFPLLKKITDKIDPTEFVQIKSEWVATLKEFLEHLVELDAEDGTSAFECYVLEK